MLVLIGSVLFATAAVSVPQGVSYPALTNTYREVVNFNAEVTRGLVVHPSGSVFALNSHASQIVRHDNLTPAPEMMFPTILNPVAIALWQRPATAQPDRILVAGAGTHALAMHRLSDGFILDVLRLPSDAGDLLVHEALDVAFVSCPGANAVVRVDLTTMAITNTIAIDSQRPRFLSFDGPAELSVLVAPFNSGNSTAVLLQEAGTQRSVVFDPVPILGPILPDEDLYSIDVGSGSVSVVKRGVGTLLTAHGQHPTTGAYWMLNVNSLNGDPARQSEPALRGNFVQNRVWIGNLNPTVLVQPSDFVDTDVATSGGPYSAANSCAFPFGIAFEAAGRVFVTSPLNDRLGVFSSTGTRSNLLQLPAGSIPLDAEIVGNYVYVYNWGTNKLQVIQLSNLATAATLELGLDPTPAPIKRGRTIWYDGDRSMHGRSSCNSCHPGGKSDFLGWQISDDPTDRKDVMVTQSLLSIEDTFPYHWRGERALIDFNGAFVDLLGAGAQLQTGANSEFADFQAFVFSLQAHANPLQDDSRTLISLSEPFALPPGSTPATVSGNPQTGKTLFTTRAGLNNQTCAGCHQAQTGTNGDFISEVNTDVPSAMVLESAHLRELTHRDQKSFFGFARTGFGTGHQGATNDIFGFLFTRLGTFNIDQTEAAHIAAFVRRFDQGIAPLAHGAFMFDQAHPGAAAQVQGSLYTQAVNGWIDLVAIGSYVDPSAGSVYRRLVFFNTGVGPAGMVFHNDGAAVNIATLTAQASLGQAQLVFFGVPPGNGRRFALDPDNDELGAAGETGAGTDPQNPDTDGDGDPDGHEANWGGAPLNRNVKSTETTPPNFGGGGGSTILDFATASMAKYRIRVNEPVRLLAAATPPGYHATITSSPVFAREQTFVVQALRPSTPGIAPGGALPLSHSITFTAEDLAGNVAVNTVSVTSGDMIFPADVNTSSGGAGPEGANLIISGLSHSKSTSGTSMTLTLTVDIANRDGAAVNPLSVQGRAVVLQVVRETTTNQYAIDPNATSTGSIMQVLRFKDPNTGDERIVGPALSPFGQVILPGPFVRAPDTDANGRTVVSVTLNNLTQGRKVRVRVIGVYKPVDPNGVQFWEGSQFLFQLPATPPAKRGIEVAFP